MPLERLTGLSMSWYHLSIYYIIMWCIVASHFFWRMQAEIFRMMTKMIFSTWSPEILIDDCFAGLSSLRKSWRTLMKFQNSITYHRSSRSYAKLHSWIDSFFNKLKCSLLQIVFRVYESKTHSVDDPEKFRIEVISTKLDYHVKPKVFKGVRN